MEERIKRLSQDSIDTKRLFFDSNAGQVAEAVRMITNSLASGGKLLTFGNGGSAADAQHIAAELVNRLSGDRPPLAALALTTDTSILTSIANDTSFDEVFARQIRALGKPGDVCLAISTSGQSSNVVRAAQAARELGIKTIALTGRGGGELARIADLSLIVQSPSTQRIQEAHITVGHIICELVEDSLFGNGRQ